MTPLSDMTGIDWQDAFQTSDYIAGASDYPPRWAATAAAFRAKQWAQLDIAYGDHPRERFDLFLPQGTPKGLCVIVHGGFWLGFDKSSWSDMARGPVSHGWAVAMPSYVLAPEASLPDITSQIGRAVTVAASMVAGPIQFTGHSAGGHLVTRLASIDGPLAPNIASRVDRVVSISGLHDLRPLLMHSMNEKLGLTEETAIQESSVLSRPMTGVRVSAWVGAAERPEFLRPSGLLAEIWGANLVADPGKHHFDVIDGLKDAAHPLTLELVKN
ncbi:MAG: alpha/beta hydrolase [Marinovum sp.]|nr:alpha/beta hydrolase [Marinovum sp.]